MNEDRRHCKLCLKTRSHHLENKLWCPDRTGHRFDPLISKSVVDAVFAAPSEADVPAAEPESVTTAVDPVVTATAVEQSPGNTPDLVAARNPVPPGYAHAPPSTLPHGTRGRYKTGCHCPKCFTANSEYQRGRKQARLKLVPDAKPVSDVKPKTVPAPPPAEPVKRIDFSALMKAVVRDTDPEGHTDIRQDSYEALERVHHLEGDELFPPARKLDETKSVTGPTRLPTVLNIRGRDDDHRNHECKNYDVCLDDVIQKGWTSFSCMPCTRYTERPPKHFDTDRRHSDPLPARTGYGR